MNGFAIAIAWPDFWGKQTGSWYDRPMRWLGENRNYHYKVGHASVILVDATGSCYYFDCGRYHTPFQFGRIRDHITDQDLTIEARAVIQKGRLINLTTILEEVQRNDSCFGVGPLHASWCEIDFDNSYRAAKRMQAMGALHFGPFAVPGTNCCRFVRHVILAGAKPGVSRIMLRHFWLIKPTPLTIVQFLHGHQIIKSGRSLKPHHSTLVYNKWNVHGNLPAPKRPAHLPANPQWLSGEVAGSWFCLEGVEARHYLIGKYSPEGKREGGGRYMSLTGKEVDPAREYHFECPSNCHTVTIRQDEGRIVLQKVD